MKETCETCAAWDAIQDNQGECHLDSPYGDSTMSAYWPSTDAADWCTEWTPREIGTCGDCRWGSREVYEFEMASIFCDDASGLKCCLENNFVTLCCLRSHDGQGVTKGRPGCGDWRPKKEAGE